MRQFCRFSKQTDREREGGGGGERETDKAQREIKKKKKKKNPASAISRKITIIVILYHVCIAQVPQAPQSAVHYPSKTSDKRRAR